MFTCEGVFLFNEDKTKEKTNEGLNLICPFTSYFLLHFDINPAILLCMKIKNNGPSIAINVFMNWILNQTVWGCWPSPKMLCLPAAHPLLRMVAMFLNKMVFKKKLSLTEYFLLSRWRTEQRGTARCWGWGPVRLCHQQPTTWDPPLTSSHSSTLQLPSLPTSYLPLYSSSPFSSFSFFSPLQLHDPAGPQS